ncbi:MAG TPA: transketolase C-terminal domain-containing protein [Thermodesulfovibrionia bacterium]|nr:transketolase C-terminal domain-containing protein [Thermodesulfovibrionia bacterium]
MAYQILNITASDSLDNETIGVLEDNARLARIDIIHEVTNPGKSGHPGGGMSSTDILTYLFARYELDADFFIVYDKALKSHGSVHEALKAGVCFPDILVISHAHISSAYYPHVVRRGILLDNALAPLINPEFKYGFQSIEEAVQYMRSHHRQTLVIERRPSIVSPFGGHLDRSMPTVAWSGGNLGQAESAAVAFAYYMKLRNINNRVIVGVGDGGSTKGQAWEAASMAGILGLDNLIVWCDYNNAQVMGSFEEVSGKVDLTQMYATAGFTTKVADGHDFTEIHNAFLWAEAQDRPSFILFQTKMGKGSASMEAKGYKCHGVGFSAKDPADARQVIAELGGEPSELDISVAKRYDIYHIEIGKRLEPQPLDIDTGQRRVYCTGDPVGLEPRKAFGAALEDLDRLNQNKALLIIGNDCDLGDSTNISKLKRVVQHGIREHHAAVFASGLSIFPDCLSFFSTFGVFGTSEVYNQLRLANANHCNLKVFLTHVGISVGEDDVTHHCLDYIGLAQNLTDFISVSVPDGNFADALTRYAAATPGNFLVTMPRSPASIVTKRDKVPFYDENYQIMPFRYDCLRKSDNPEGAIIAHGVMVGKALEVYKLLCNQGVFLNVYAAPFVKNVDRDALKDALATGNVFIYEDHLADTGLGSILAGAIANDKELRKLHGQLMNWQVFGIRKLGPSGSYTDLYKFHALDPLSVAEKLTALIA